MGLAVLSRRPGTDARLLFGPSVPISSAGMKLPNTSPSALTKGLAASLPLPNHCAYSQRHQAARAQLKGGKGRKKVLIIIINNNKKQLLGQVSAAQQPAQPCAGEATHSPCKEEACRHRGAYSHCTPHCTPGYPKRMRMGIICSSGASSQLCAHLPPRMEHANVGAAAEFPSASIRERGWKTKVASCCPQQTFKECQS